ncbi:threonine ammonia-lyase [Jiulongibacter sediminis]|uniref:L-threonine dehydratase n=1 Tax=Jiulongibacter sediminis TaxID=1605367 RepID=A0A0P7C5K4_9BACT|nr:threonine ammonia-lyase [Jiulongibacter sediminis]KPM48592.1 threonine dehydratase [Jiulongibacter sediminis]TBX25130.1 threonine dehydratase [Jiulongibacter sediminis]
MEKPQFDKILQAAERLAPVVTHTLLQFNASLSEKFEANVYLKREDLQVVRSYKLRGAYNKMSTLTPSELTKGVICASAGNHAQGVAWACQYLQVKGTIFMPSTTPAQKIRQVRLFGKEWIDIRLTGDTYDDASNAARVFENETGGTFIHPFDDISVMEGQGTVGLEIVKDADFEIDYVLFAIGGGGLGAGVSTVFKARSPQTKLIGVEPEGAASMKASLAKGEVVSLEEIDKFVDGAAVKRVGEMSFAVCKENLNKVLTVPEGKVCSTILDLYSGDAIVAEPAGALSIAALDDIAEEIKGKNVVCILGGGNNDILRMEEIRERSLLYEGLKHYFIIRFAQRAGALQSFVNDALGPTDDIVFFEYSKKTARERGPALVGIEIKAKEDFQSLITRMKAAGIEFTYINDKPELFEFLI